MNVLKCDERYLTDYSRVFKINYNNSTHAYILFKNSSVSLLLLEENHG